MTMDGRRAKSTRTASVRAAPDFIGATAYIRNVRCRRCQFASCPERRQLNAEFAAKIQSRTRRSHGPPMHLDQVAHHGEANAVPAFGGQRRWVYLHQHLENARKLPCRETNTRITNA